MAAVQAAPWCMDRVSSRQPAPAALAAGLHAMRPAANNKPAAVRLADDMGPVQQLRRMQRGTGVAQLRGNDQSLVLPRVEVSGCIAAHTPVPDPASGHGVLLVFSIPVEDPVQVQDGAAMRLNASPVGIQHLLARPNCQHHGSLRLSATRALALGLLLPTLYPRNCAPTGESPTCAMAPAGSSRRDS